MKYAVFMLKTNNVMTEQWIRHPVTQREFPVFGNKTEVYECDTMVDAEQTADHFARQNPGNKVWIAEATSSTQAPLHKGELTITTITEKGMLPL